MEYHVTRYDQSGHVLREVSFLCRKRADAAWLAFNRAVDRMVRDHAALDTQHGTDAQRKARGTVVPKGFAPWSATVAHGGDLVLLEALQAR